VSYPNDDAIAAPKVGHGFPRGSSLVEHFTADVLGLLGLPVFTGIAIVRHRLYDIDLIINRSLVYGVLTGTLALIYFGGVTATQVIFHTHRPRRAAPTRHSRALREILDAIFYIVVRSGCAWRLLCHTT